MTDWRTTRIAMLDCETTGKDPNTERIVEVACVIAEGGEIIASKSWLVHPQCSIPPDTTAIHGITDAMVRGAPAFADVALDLFSMVGEAIPAAYNAPFDRSFISAEWDRLGLDVPPFALLASTKWIDPLVWIRRAQKYEKSKKLGDVARRMNIDAGEAHRATSDAETALRILFKLGTDRRMPATLDDLLARQVVLAAEQEADYAAWRARKDAAGGR